MAENEANQVKLPEGSIEIPPGAPVTTVRAPNMPVVYVSNAGLAVSSMDVRLFVGDVLPNTAGSGVTVTQRLCLIMTPEYAKAVAENLLLAMKNFEVQFGKLRDLTGPKPAQQQSQDQK